MNFTAFYTEYGEPKPGLSPTIDIRRIDLVPVPGSPFAMLDIGGGFYAYDYLLFNPAISYVAVCDGWAGAPPPVDSLDQRYTYGGNTIEVASIAAGVWDEPAALHVTAGTFGSEVNITYADAEEVLDLLENKLTIDPVLSTLNLWDDTGAFIIKTWPIKDKTAAPGTVTLANLPTTVPVDRDVRTL